MKALRVLFVCLVALAFASCGAGGGGPVPATNDGGRTPAQTHARQITVPKTAQRRRMDASGALADPGFESGGYTYWQQCGNVNASITTAKPHSGSYSELSGKTSTPEINGDAGVCQQVTIPASGGYLTFYYYLGTNETSTTYAYQEADLLDSNGNVVHNFYTVANSNGWTKKTYSVNAYAGQTLWLYFGVHADGYSSGYIYQYVDDVAWSTGSSPSPSPSPSPSKSPSPTPAPTATPTPSGGPTPIATPANGGGNSTGSCGTSCGVQRWHIKTLGDAYVTTINWTPVSKTGDQMRAAPVPSGYDEYNDTTRYAPWETESVTVRATLVGWKTETDHDYHMVIADLNNPSDTMIIEPPDPTCSSACDGGFANYFQATRTKLVNCFGSPPSSFGNLPAGIVVDVTGVPEFDALHGQTGVAPNGIEIHPVLNINFVSGTSCK